VSHGTLSPHLRQNTQDETSARRSVLFPSGASIFSAQNNEAVSGLAALYMPAVVALTLGAFALRIVMLDRFPFREDEALYGYWALHGWLEDPQFLRVWPDKPPLFVWLLGGAFRLFGVSEASARWVNVAASTLLVPVVAATAGKLWGRSAAVAAAAVLALNPYAISFGATAYTDPVLVLAGMLAFCAAVYGRALGAGLLLGAAVMTKQQGVLYVPLALGGLLLVSDASRAYTGRTLRRYALLAAGATLAVLPILYWDSLRWHIAPSPWDLSVRNYSALALLEPAAWPARAASWGPLVWDLAASWAAWAGLAVLAALAAGGVLAARWAVAPLRVDSAGARRDAALLLIGGWSLAFLAAHVVTTVQPWDRYLLPLAPMLALGAGWAVSRLASVLKPKQLAAASAAVLILLIAPAQQAANGRIAVGGDHGDYAGLPAAIQAVQALNDRPFILYHRALGSHYRFYLYDAVDERAVDLRWFSGPVYLADNAAKMPYPHKSLIEPDWAPVRDLEPYLAMRSLNLTRHGRYGRFTLWEIARQPAPPCDWCVSRAPAHWPEAPGLPPHAKMTPR
jgi:4-amino-4-deoxy-L-arabinose transferase-like glycosyltransferase